MSKQSICASREKQLCSGLTAPSPVSELSDLGLLQALLNFFNIFKQHSLIFLFSPLVKEDTLDK